MSADTTVVIAAYRFPGGNGLSYTAQVVQAVENLMYYGDKRDVEYAKDTFGVNDPRFATWFMGTGGLRRAKQFASLLAEETRENGILEYENRPIIEIAEDKTYTLSKHGRRKDVQWKPQGSAWMDDHPRRGMPIPHAAEYVPRYMQRRS